MENTIEALRRELMAKGVQPSYHRLRVFGHLRHVGGHPTADDIYRRLVEEIPTLARATVYNSLHALVEAGLARVIDAGDGETRYDAVIESHGHFRCDACGAVTDFCADLDSLTVAGLAGYQVRMRNVLFRGLCPRCVLLAPKDDEE